MLLCVLLVAMHARRIGHHLWCPSMPTLPPPQPRGAHGRAAVRQLPRGWIPPRPDRTGLLSSNASQHLWIWVVGLPRLRVDYSMWEASVRSYIRRNGSTPVVECSELLYAKTRSGRYCVHLFFFWCGKAPCMLCRDVTGIAVVEFVLGGRGDICGSRVLKSLLKALY